MRNNPSAADLLCLAADIGSAAELLSHLGRCAGAGVLGAGKRHLPPLLFAEGLLWLFLPSSWSRKVL